MAQQEKRSKGLRRTRGESTASPGHRVVPAPPQRDQPSDHRDVLPILNRLREREGRGGQVQTDYLDPPCGVSCGSSFQPFVNRGEVTDVQDQDLAGEPEPIRTIRDARNLGVHGIESFKVRDLGT